jgi:hypothetical protein
MADSKPRRFFEHPDDPRLTDEQHLFERTAMIRAGTLFAPPRDELAQAIASDPEFAEYCIARGHIKAPPKPKRVQTPAPLPVPPIVPGAEIIAPPAAVPPPVVTTDAPEGGPRFTGAT